MCTYIIFHTSLYRRQENNCTKHAIHIDKFKKLQRTYSLWFSLHLGLLSLFPDTLHVWDGAPAGGMHVRLEALSGWSSLKLSDSARHARAPWTDYTDRISVVFFKCVNEYDFKVMELYIYFFSRVLHFVKELKIYLFILK